MTVNPGLFLPFYDRLNDQFRFKWGHQWGMIADVNTLIPFQLPLASTEGLALYFVKADGTEVIPWNSIPQIYSGALSKWLVWLGTGNVGVTLTCGLWFIKVVTDRAVYYSEVLDLQKLPDYEHPGLTLGACSSGASITFEVTANDSAASGVEWQAIDQWNGTTWVTIGTDTGTATQGFVVDSDDWGTVLVRRKIKTGAGNLLTAFFSIGFEWADPCGTAMITESRSEGVFAQPFLKKLTVGNNFDTEGILYSTGWLQTVWLNGYDDKPQAQIERETLVNGNGLLLTTSSNVKERKVLVCDEIPDFLVHPLSTFPGLATQVIKDVHTGSSWVPREAEVTFSPTEEGYFQKATITFTTDTFYQTGCEENETVTLGG